MLYSYAAYYSSVQSKNLEGNLFYAYSLQPQSDIHIINAWIFHALEMCNEYIFLT